MPPHEGIPIGALPPAGRTEPAKLPPSVRYDPVTDRVGSSWLARWLVTPPRWILWVLRATRVAGPLPWQPGWLNYRFIARHAEVVEVLSRPDVFRVGFGDEVARFNDGEAPGTPFLIGIDRARDHDEQLKTVMQIIRRADIDAYVVPIAREHAQARIEERGTEAFDAITDLVTAVPVALCDEYLGIAMREEERETFALATLTVSGHLFGGAVPSGNDADAAAAYFRAVVDRAILDEIARGGGDRTILQRMVRHHMSAGRIPLCRHRQIRAILMGLVVGCVPTFTLAGGHILEVLLDHPDWLEQAAHAAREGNDALLERCLFEALRFMPVNPGAFRICSRDHVLAADTPRAVTIRKGTRVLAMTFSAMFDPRAVERPGDFLPQRPPSDHLHFGFGFHHCVGTQIARALLRQVFTALLARGPIERASPLQLRGGAPRRLMVRLGSTAGSA